MTGRQRRAENGGPPFAISCRSLSRDPPARSALNMRDVLLHESIKLSERGGMCVRAVVLIVGVCLLWTGEAAAAGGPSVAAAPLPTIGQPQFRTLAAMVADATGSQNEYWRVPLTSGDRVAIDY